MYKLILVSTFCIATIFNLSAQNSFIVTPKVGTGLADGTICMPFGVDLGYEFSTNRIFLDMLVATKKRNEFRDALIADLTLGYSKIYKKEKFSLVPGIGAGLVSGSWKKYADGDGEYFQTGFGLAFMCSAEYPVKKYLHLSLKYEQALLLEDFTGNGSIVAGFVFKI